MPTFKVRTYEENVTVEADLMEVCEDGVRLMFFTAGKVTTGFSRYLWVQEVKTGPFVETPVTEEPAPAEPVSE